MARVKIEELAFVDLPYKIRLEILGLVETLDIDADVAAGLLDIKLYGVAGMRERRYFSSVRIDDLLRRFHINMFKRYESDDDGASSAYFTWLKQKGGKRHGDEKDVITRRDKQ